MSMTGNEWKPKIVAFCCNWCSYAGADLAGSGRLSYPAEVKIIRVPCSCRVNPLFILKAFERGADGVIIARPFVAAVYGGGADGVQAYVDKIGAELEDTMAMCGAKTLADITPDMIWHAK